MANHGITIIRWCAKKFGLTEDSKFKKNAVLYGIMDDRKKNPVGLYRLRHKANRPVKDMRRSVSTVVNSNYQIDCFYCETI